MRIFLLSGIVFIGLLLSFQNIKAQTFNGQGGLLVPPGAPAQTVGITISNVNVSGIGNLGACSIVESVTMDFLHTWVGDVAIFLISPAGTVLELTSGNGGSGDNFQVTTFTDSAPTFITAGNPPYNGSFRPEGRQQNTNCACSNANPLGTFTFANTFAGENADGTWQLYINDYVAVDVGLLNSWSITFSSNGGAPTANPATITGCNNGNGQATFNLTTIESTVNGGTGSPVSWWLDAAATNPITNPTNFISAAGTIYATVGSGACISAPVPITLQIPPALTTANTFITINPTSGCGPTTVNATFTFPGPGPYNVIFQFGNPANPQPSNGVALTNGSVITYSLSQTTVFILTQITDANGCTTTLQNPQTVTFNATSPPTITLLLTPTICAGESVDLSTLVTTNSGLPITFHTTVPPSIGNQLPGPVVSPAASTIFYGFVNAGPGCTVQVPIPVTVNSSAAPQLGTSSICQTVNNFNLTALQDPAFPSGTWSGPGVSGNFFSAVGQTGTVTLTFDPSAPCAQNATTTVNILQQTTPTLTTTSVCQNQTGFNLASLQDPTFPGGTWSGPGVSGNLFNASGLNGPVTLTYTPVQLCANPATTTVNVTPSVTPVLSTISLCQNDPSFALSSIADPAFPNGTWSGPGVSGNVFNPAGLSGNITLTFLANVTCAVAATTSVSVITSGTPLLTSANICETTTGFSLTTLQDPAFPNGTWSGPGVSGNLFSASGQTGSVTLTFQPSAPCAQTATTTVNVLPQATPALMTANVCQNQTGFNLATLQDPAFPGGTWSGPGVSGNLFNASGLNGPVTLIYTPAQFCANPASTTVNVTPGVTPVLGTISLCQNDPSFALSSLADPAFPNGTWSGPGVSGNVFNPAGLSGNITLTFQANANCAVPASTSVSVVASGTPQLSPANVCETQTGFSLTALQDPAFPNGIWSGPGVSGNLFSAVGQTGSVTLTFQPSAPCAQTNTTIVSILPQASPNLGADNLCESQTNFNLTPLQDPAFPNGIWNGPGVSGIFFNPVGQSGPVTLIFTPTASCSQPGSTVLTVDEAPETTAPVAACSPGNLSYTVTFEISGGAANTYTVNGQPSSAIFTSAPVPSGSPFSYLVDDINGCGPTIVNGSFNCDCVTFAGSMNFAGSPFEVCSDAVFTANFNNNNVLDGDDVLQFVLHDQPGPSLGNILAINNLPVFGFPANGQLGVSYYVSAVAANNDGTGNFNPADGCLSVAAGVPVVFYETSATAGPGGSICADDCFSVPLSFEGVAPFTFSYQLATPNGTGNEVFNTAQNNDPLVICPADFGVGSGQILIQPIDLTDANGCNVSLSSAPQIAIEVQPVPEFSLAQTLCPGETVTVNGTVYNAANPAGSEVFPNGSVLSCDSIVNVNLSFFPAAVGQLSPTLCTGGSLTVNGTVYNEANPTGTEVLANASVNGCDSTVQVSLNFNNAVNFSLSQTLCPGESLTVNGTVYNAANPTGSELFPNGSVLGCDSIVNVSLSFFPAAIGQLSPTLCTGGSLTVNGTIYNEANPAGTEILANASANGCDSTVQISLDFNSAVSFSLAQTLCPGEAVTVNGTVYNAANPSGSEVFPNGSALGCDSIVNVNLSFFPAAVGQLSPILCIGGSLTVNGTVYNEANPTGTEILANASVNGCDSTVQISLSFNDAVSFSLSQTLCPGESLTVNGTVYNAANPTGSELFPNGSVLGCDSIVNVNLSFFPVAVGQLSQTLCTGGSLMVNGTIYNEANPTGTEVLANASVNGCDSTVQILLNFNSAVSFSLAQTLCPGESLTVNGTVYNAANPTGSELFPNGSALGCDSIVNVNLSFFPAAVGQLSQTLCTGGSLTVNGTVYNEANPTGTEILANASVNGCDSTVQILLNFNSAVSFSLAQTLCPGESLTVNGTVYNAANPTGSELFPNGSVQGCDSIVNVSLSFLTDAVFELSQTLAPGGSIVVNGTVYDESNPAGVEVLENAAANGCDSNVIINLAFLPDALLLQFSANAPSCDGDTDGQLILENISGGSGNYFVALNGQPAFPVGSLPAVLGGLAPGTYDLTLSDDTGFSIVQTVNVPTAQTILLELGDDVTAALGDPVFLNALTNISPAVINWEPTTYLSCTDCLQPVVEKPTGSIVYTLTIADENGCTATDAIEILLRKPRQVYVPNAFSPNGDGFNDEVTVFAGNDVVVVRSFLIFDRWGATVYEFYNLLPNDLSLGWDGTNRGEPLNPGVFVYFAEVEFLDGETSIVKGSVTLVR